MLRIKLWAAMRIEKQEFVTAHIILNIKKLGNYWNIGEKLWKIKL